jgi:transcriptional regulator with XRE-family HTH domain
MGVNGLDLRLRRLEAGLSQEELASNIGVSQAFVSQLEKGTRVPSGNLAEQLSAELKIPLEAFRNDEELESLRSRIIRRVQAMDDQDQLAAINAVLTQFRRKV